jgi:hypothetical protein
MNGNIDQHLNMVNTTTVRAKGWLEFGPADPPSVQVWAGVGQGDRNSSAANGAVYGDGWKVVNHPNPGGAGNVIWQFDVTIKNGAGTYKHGVADGGAVAIAGGVEPYPWGRQVQL